MAYLPKPYTDFTETYPEITEAYQALAAACHERGGPLDGKARHLIKLGIATALQSEGAVKSHTRQSLENGASEQEIRHAVILALTTCGFPGTVAALGWVSEVLAAR
jgi:alkylhydroperoxidase/carboxymuconolactone decarboxylase family protein YurZ